MGRVVSPLLLFQYTNSSVSLHPSVKLLKIADDNTLVGLNSSLPAVTTGCSILKMVVDLWKDVVLTPHIMLHDIPGTAASSSSALYKMKMSKFRPRLLMM